MRRIVHAVSLTLAIALSSGCAAGDPPPPGGTEQAGTRGVLSISPASWNFGEINQTAPQTATLTARNDGTGPLKLLSLDGT